MSPANRLFTLLYGATALWLAYCTVTTWHTTEPWARSFMIAASLTAILALLGESDLASARRTNAALQERLTRHTPLPADGDPLDEDEQAAFHQITAHYEENA